MTKSLRDQCKMRVGIGAGLNLKKNSSIRKKAIQASPNIDVQRITILTGKLMYREADL